MSIILRKVRGKLTPLFRTNGGGSFSVGAAPSAVMSFLTSPLMLAVLLVALALTWVLSGAHLPVLHVASNPVAGLMIGSLVTAKSLREKRATLVSEATAILDDAGKREAGKQDLTPEEQTKFDAIHADVEALGKRAESIEKHERVVTELGESRGLVAGRQNSGTEVADVKVEEQKRNAAFSTYLRYGTEGLEPEQRSMLRFSRDNTAPVNAEYRAPQTVTTTGGGYLIPAGFSNQLEVSMKLYGGVEQAADAFSTDTGNPLPWPTVDDTAQSGAMLAINTQIAEQIVTYGVVNFSAYKMTSKLVLVPVELMQDSAFDLDSHLAAVLGERLGRIHNSYQTTGTASSEPGGIQTGGSSGVTAAGATAITYDELLDLEHSVDPAYRLSAFNAGFMLNDGSLLKLKKLKDGEGRPLWQSNPQVGAPSTIDGFPYHINQDMPAMTTGLKPVLFGALKKFKIRNVKGFTLLRLVERYADYHQIGFVAFTRFDSHVLDAGTDPLKYITMA